MRITGSYNCLVVLGPTASGKTALAAKLAHVLKGEVISADSRQVYKGLDIGTGKDLHEFVVEGGPVPYHLIDVAEPGTQFYLHDFAARLNQIFLEVRSKDRVPVICGGTGLYLDALRKDLSFTQVPEDHRLREVLKALTPHQLSQKLASYEQPLLARVDKTSVKRMVRGIEIAEFLKSNTLRPQSEVIYKPYYLGIKPTREELHRKIEQRLDRRLREGLIEEVRQLLKEGISRERLEQLGLEYRFVSLFLAGELSLDELRVRLLTAIRQFAKRQMTWFRKMEKEGVSIHWLDSPEPAPEMIHELTAIFSAPPPR